MIKNKKKFKNGIQKITVAIGLAFAGPVIFVLNSHYTSSLINLLLIVLGLTLMISCVIMGIWGVQNLLAGFFESPNE